MSVALKNIRMVNAARLGVGLSLGAMSAYAVVSLVAGTGVLLYTLGSPGPNDTGRKESLTLKFAGACLLLIAAIPLLPLVWLDSP